MCMEKEFLSYECGYENGLDDVVGEQQEIEAEEIKEEIIANGTMRRVTAHECLNENNMPFNSKEEYLSYCKQFDYIPNIDLLRLFNNKISNVKTECRSVITKVYVASPVRPVLEFTRLHNDIEHGMNIVKTFAQSGCEAVKKMGFVPVSPILAFNGVYEEYSERDHIDAACEALLLMCDYIYVVETPYNDRSKGISRELELAQQYGISPLYIMQKDRE